MEKKIILGKKYNFLIPILHPNLSRLGNNKDGGYILDLNILKKTKYLLSFGVGDNWSFEKACLKKNPKIIIKMFDYSIDIREFYKLFFKHIRRFFTLRSNFENIKNTFKILNNYNNFKKFFKKKNIEYYPNKITQLSESKLEKSLIDILNSIEGKIIIKCDIEGNEYDLFYNLNYPLKNVEIIIIEFHWIEKNFNKFKKIILQLKKNFEIAHFHVNNNSILEKFDKMPDYIELTFFKKKNKLNSKKRYHFPIRNLDFPNNPNISDYLIHFSKI